MRYDQQLEGKNVLLLGRESPMAQSIRDLFTQHGAVVTALDSREAIETPSEAVAVTQTRCIPPWDILVTVFSGSAWGLVCDVAEEDLSALTRQNLRAAFACVRKVLPGMKQRVAGSIVHVLPMYAQKTVPGVAAAALVSGGIAALSRATAIEYGKFFIRSNCLLFGPGFLAGPEGDVVRHAQLLKDPVGFAEIADAALYLAGDMSAHVTGEWLSVDGGASVIAHNQLFERGGWFE